jgi:DNA polymerase III epsilon subunit-like protein
MYLFFDTETTGLPKDYKAKITKVDNWPRIVSLAFLLTDGSGEKVRESSYIIKPDGFEIPPEASAIHGITTVRAAAEGVPMAGAILSFLAAVSNAAVLVAHNIDYDSCVLGAEIVRAFGETEYRKIMDEQLGTTRKYLCTMQESIELCKLPGKYGFKFPKLAELHKFLFGEVPAKVHDAAAGVAICAKCFFEMRRKGYIKI